MDNFTIQAAARPLVTTPNNVFIQPDTAIASSEFTESFDGRAIHTIDGSGFAVGFGADDLHAPYASGNHWTSANNTRPRDQWIEWGFHTPKTLDTLYLWNHQSTSGMTNNPDYDVTQFDLTFLDPSGTVLASFDDWNLRPELAAAQTFSLGQEINNVSRVRLEIENVQSSTTLTGLAEVGFNTVISQ